MSRAIASCLERVANSEVSLKSIVDSLRPDPSPSHRVAPCLGFIKVNCDGAYSEYLSFGTTAFLARDSYATFINGGSIVFSLHLVLCLPKLKQCCFGLWNPLFPVIESDCRRIIEWVSSSAPCSSFVVIHEFISKVQGSSRISYHSLEEMATRRPTGLLLNISLKASLFCGSTHLFARS